MKKYNPRIHYNLGVLASLGVFVLLLEFTHAFLYEAPYPGFYFNPTQGRIHEFYGEAGERDTLREGDQLFSVGGITWDEYLRNRTIQFFDNYDQGDTVEIVVLRGEDKIPVPWVIPGRTTEEFMARLINAWWLGYIFWIFGVGTQLFIRPRDTRWRLLVALNEITGFWLVLGNISSLRVWDSSILLRAVTWLAVPVYLNLHWIFPKPLKRIPAWGWAIFYLLCIGLAVGEILQLFHGGLYFIGVLIMFGGSIVLLILHSRNPSERGSVRLLLISLLMALLPVIGVGISGLTGSIPEISIFGLLALTLMPAAYFVIISRQQLGGMEVRANRIFSIFAFLTILATLILLLFGMASSTDVQFESPFLTVIVTGLATVVVSILVFPAFEAFTNQRILGIKLPYQHLPSTYSSRIVTSASMLDLLNLLEEDVFPSLLVRQYAFIQITGETYEKLLVKGIAAEDIPAGDDLAGLVILSGRYRPPEEGLPHPWIRLVLSLKAGNETIGLWLLGRRDPDDDYHAAEIPIFQSLADQTAIAMSNILQAERLRSMYQLDIDRREEERKRLALGLHDSVLNQLAALRMNVEESSLTPSFQQAYEEVVQRLREIVSGLRPPMLNYGLKLALEELAQELTEQSGDQAEVTLDLQADEVRYPANIELHLFRIVQESCENALRHAKAAHVRITARLESHAVAIRIEDDGVGFVMGERLELDDLLINKHFGLAGILERANLVGAKIEIKSGLNMGTRVQVTWNDAPQDAG